MAEYVIMSFITCRGVHMDILKDILAPVAVSVICAVLAWIVAKTTPWGKRVWADLDKVELEKHEGIDRMQAMGVRSVAVVSVIALVASIAAIAGIAIDRFGRKGLPGSDLPMGTVMAFDLDTCPSSWTPFKPATGRVIIGQGNSYEGILDKDYRGEKLTARAFHESGGSEVYNIEIADFPADLKSVSVQPSASDAYAPLLITSSASKFRDARERNLPKGGMPPFYALTYCRKESH
jgi:hypothetical protein